MTCVLCARLGWRTSEIGSYAPPPKDGLIAFGLAVEQA
jgi:hypothetical protein